MIPKHDGLAVIPAVPAQGPQRALQVAEAEAGNPQGVEIFGGNDAFGQFPRPFGSAGPPVTCCQPGQSSARRCWTSRPFCRAWQHRLRSAVQFARERKKRVLCAVMRVDLNPVRAGISETLRDSEHTSVRHRLESGRSAR